MKKKTLRMLTISQIAVFLLLIFLTLGNEIIDIPHYVFNDTPETFPQRLNEMMIELTIYVIVMAIQILWFRKLFKSIRVLEGFIPICANCKKIRTTENQWEQMEKYISEHSLAQFSHSICPDCARKLYPHLYDDKMKGEKRKLHD
jgi:hypothetical protein